MILNRSLTSTRSRTCRLQRSTGISAKCTPANTTRPRCEEPPRPLPWAGELETSDQSSPWVRIPDSGPRGQTAALETPHIRTNAISAFHHFNTSTSTHTKHSHRGIVPGNSSAASLRGQCHIFCFFFLTCFCLKKWPFLQCQARVCLISSLNVPKAGGVDRDAQRTLSTYEKNRKKKLDF